MPLNPSWSFSTREICISKDHVGDILEAASFLVVKPVKDICSNILQDSLQISNYISTKWLADQYYLVDLRKRVNQLIRSEFYQLGYEEEFLELNYDELYELLSSSGDMDVKSEENVVLAVLNWVKHDPVARAKHLSSILPCLKLKSMQIAFLEEQMSREPLLQDCSYFCNLLRNQPAVQNVIVSVGKGFWRTVFCYNTETDVFYQLPQIPSPHFVIGMAVLGTDIYCVTRILESSGGNNPFLKFSLDGDQTPGLMSTWENIHSPFKGVSDCNKPKLITLAGKLYLVSGCGIQNPEELVYCYNPAIMEWFPVAPLNHPRCQIQVVSTSKHLYSIGGRIMHAIGDAERFVEKYDPDSDTWTVMSPLIKARLWPTVVATSNTVFVIGGCGTEEEDDEEEEEGPHNNNNTKKKKKTTKEEEKDEEYDDEEEDDDDDEEYDDDDGEQGVEDVEVYHELTDQWSVIARLPCLQTSLELCTVLRGEVYVMDSTHVWKYNATENKWNKSNKLPSLPGNFVDNFCVESTQLPMLCVQRYSSCTAHVATACHCGDVFNELIPHRLRR